MPELRSARARGRACALGQPVSIEKPKRNPRRRAAAKKPRTRLAVEKDKNVILEGENTEKIQEKVSPREEIVGKPGVMGDDSAGLSANKAAGQEEEGSTAPFPERVISSISNFEFSLFLNFLFLLSIFRFKLEDLQCIR